MSVNIETKDFNICNFRLKGIDNNYWEIQEFCDCRFGDTFDVRIRSKFRLEKCMFEGLFGKEKELNLIKKVIFNNPATIVFWYDGTKTVVKCKYEKFDKEKGLAMAISKKFFGNKENYYMHFKKWIKENGK